MEIKIKCQHSGIEFNAGNKRTKQHPLIAEFKNESAGRRGDYRLACQALDKAAELGNYETIDEYMAIVTDIYTGTYDKKTKAQARREEEEKEHSKAQREARAKRETQNRHLREHGYRWEKEYNDPAYAAGWGEDNSEVWVLLSSDGRAVTVPQALDEIERGAEVVLAEIETAKKAEVEAQEVVEKAEKEYQQTWEDAKDKIKIEMTEVERFDYTDWTITFNRSCYKTITTIEKIFTGQKNNVDCAVIYRYIGGHDFEETEQFYSANPVAAGLTVIERSEMEASFHRFFGE